MKSSSYDSGLDSFRKISHNGIMINDFTERLSFRLGIIFFLALAFYLVALSEVWAAGSLSLSPTTQSGTEFTVQVNLDTGTDATIETDLLLTYDPAILNIDN